MAAAASSSALIQLAGPWSSSDTPVGSLSVALGNHPDKELQALFEKSQRAFDEIASRHFPRWVVTFSGGKDSTLTALLAADYLSQIGGERPRLDVVYSDTLMEIPAMRKAAGSFLRYMRQFSKEHDLPIQVRIVRPKVEDRYWVRMIGKGYPPPKPKFRWCTRRLKITPAAPFVNTGKPTAVLTGVRYGESAQRTGRLVASCTNGGECGQDYWAARGPRGSNITYFAPVIDWRTCKVWDFLHFVAPEAGWPTQDVFALYGDTSLRFGCWTCTLVRRDKTVESLIEREPGSSLEQLHEFREFIWEESKKPENRLVKNGHLAGLTVAFRRELLSRLRELERETDRRLISDAEVSTIRSMWRAALRDGARTSR
jgi:DNA sulfur modification protein DndC